MTEKKPRKKREGFKTAPPGFYTAREAMDVLGMKSSTFYYHVDTGAIPRMVPPLRKEGFYPKKEIDQLATKIALFLQAEAQEQSSVDTRVARPEDAQGVVDVLHSLGWQCPTAEQYQAWWRVNPFIHFVVRDHGRVVGNLACVPYTQETLDARMAGYKRAWQVLPSDIQLYHTGFNDVYVGGEVRQDMADHTRYAFRLIAGFLTFLEDLAAQGIIIHHMYAMSAEPDGQQLCRHLGFIERPNKEGELYAFQEGKPIIRFVLDLVTADSRFAKQYRKVWKH